MREVVLLRLSGPYKGTFVSAREGVFQKKFDNSFSLDLRRYLLNEEGCKYYYGDAPIQGIEVDGTLILIRDPIPLVYQAVYINQN